MSRPCFKLIVAAFAVCAPELVHAQQTDDRYELTVGAGGGVKPSYAGSDDSVTVPFAGMRGRVDDFVFFSRGSNLSFDLVRERDRSALDVAAGPVINLRSDRNSKIKDPQVSALGKLNRAWEVGGWVGIGKMGVITSDYDNLSARVTVLKDVGNAHKSYIVTPAIEYGTPLSPATYVGVSVSADYVGKGFGHYYYDISLAGSQASGLGVYGAAGDKAGFAKLNLGVVAAQSLSGDLRKGLAVFALGGYGRMLGRYADSPIVRDAGRRNQWMGGAGIAYTF